MTTFVTPGSPTHQESPITVIPTPVIYLQRWQIDSLATFPGSLGHLERIVDIRALKGGTDEKRFYLDYAQLTCELPESIGLLKEWSCPAAVFPRRCVRPVWSLAHGLRSQPSQKMHGRWRAT